MKPAGIFLIGLTGNIGCGKSTVREILQELGAATIDADAVTRQLQSPGQPVYDAIVEVFGPDVLTEPGGPLDRQRIASVVFSDPDALRRLEAIVHPAVHRSLVEWLGALAAPIAPSRHTVAVIDAIKLLETGWKAHCDEIWIVTCSMAQQIERLKQTRGMSEAEIQQRIAAQPSQGSRLVHADVIIDNDRSVEHTRAQIVEHWNRIMGDLA